MNNKKITVRDKIWLFASRAHDDDHFLQPIENRFSADAKRDRFATRSRITPAEGALMLGVNNVMMIVSDGIPASFSEDAYGYMESFCRMDNVLWSVTGSGGFRSGNEEAFICELAGKYPNMKGAFLDDFTWDHKLNRFKTEEEVSAELLEIRERLDRCERPLELWSTCYAGDVEKFSAKMYDPIDVITVWGMSDERLRDMENSLASYEKLLPNKRKVYGMYLYNYGKSRPVPVDLMEYQCETALKWLREGRIEGMIFLTNCVMGIGLESEYYLRKWIDKVGDIEL